MKVFLSWSGPASKQIALALREWLPNVIQAIDPWMSARDIEKGSRWSSALTRELATTKAGIVCLTPDNPDAAWLNFESGALSKAVDETMVCPYLLHLKPSELTGPLAQFQMSETNREDTQRMLVTLNGGTEKPIPERKLLEAFELWWPQLEAKLIAIPSTVPPENTRRTSEDMLEEVLAIVRDQSRTAENIFSIVQQIEWREVASQNTLLSPYLTSGYLSGPVGASGELIYGGLPSETPAPRARMSNGRLYFRASDLNAANGEPEKPEIDDAGPLKSEDV